MFFLAVPLAAVPEIVAVPSALSAKVRPLGKVPIRVRAGVGKPEVVTVKVPDVPAVKVAFVVLVEGRNRVHHKVEGLNARARTVGRGNGERIIAAGFGARRARTGWRVPFPASTKRSPAGRIPSVTDRAAVGAPVVVTLNVPD